MMIRRGIPFPLLAAAALLILSCKDSSGPAGPRTIRVSATSVTLDAIGASQVVTASVWTEDGQEVRGAPITWTSGSGGVSVLVNPADQRAAELKAVSSGTARVTARSGNVTAHIDVDVAQRPTTLIKQGDLQDGVVGAALPSQLRVTARDRFGHTVAGAEVSFVVRQGAGLLSAATVVTDASGMAAVTWTLGTSAASPQEVVASSGAAEAVFSATPHAAAAASMQKLAGDEQAAPAGTAVPIRPSVRVTDAFGNPVVGGTVYFVPTAGSGTVGTFGHLTDLNGVATVDRWTLGYPEGDMSLSVTVSGVDLPAVVFRATATPGPEPGELAVLAGAWQVGLAGSTATTNPSVVVRNLNGQPMAGKTVKFSVASGGGSVSGELVTTNAEGVAEVREWTLGSVPGLNGLTATVVEGPVSNNLVTFTATACSTGPEQGFTINVCFMGPVTASQRAAFLDAAARWSSIITGNLQAVQVTFPAPSCGAGTPPIDMRIDDLLIFAIIEPIDGTGGTLGSAGPCIVRSGSWIPVAGRMRFDAADVGNLQASGRFLDVVLHEMGHVLGIGTIWNQVGLLRNPSQVGGPPLDTHFAGTNAIAGFDLIGGLSYSGGAKVPVENGMGAGSINGHWRESVLGSELMTPQLNSSVANPLTVLTVLSLADLGYIVDPTRADPHSVQALHGDVESTSPPIRLHDDLYRGPLFTVDQTGRVHQIR